MQNKDLRTLAYVLKRVNYGEADRILNLITPSGKIAAIAKGVRKEKSKLAGGVEIFSLVDINVRQGKSELGVITNAKMLKYYAGILKDFNRLELASLILKKVSFAAESSDNSDFFRIVDQALKGLDAGDGLELVEAWFWLNLLKASGEEINLYRDVMGEKLRVDLKYDWDEMEGAFKRKEHGEYGENDIKMLRLMLATDLEMVRRVKRDEQMMEKILRLARTVNRI